MNSLLMLSALMLGGDPPADGGEAYYIETPVLQFAAAKHGNTANAFGAYEGGSFDGHGWGYHTGNYSGWCPITRRSVANMSIWDNYCWETSHCGHQNGSHSCSSHRKSNCRSCESHTSACGCGGHAGHHSGHVHAHGGVIIESELAPTTGDATPPSALPSSDAAGAPPVDGGGVTKIRGGRYDDFLLEPGEQRDPVNAPWIKRTNLRTKPTENAEPRLRNWLFPRSRQPELPAIAPNSDEKITGSDSFFSGEKQK
ncbi:MAG: hypothetical protein MPJ50_17750 [Pirellulales bacterium]|nr:hypothetical protein [Pirellulales bacterium]